MITCENYTTLDLISQKLRHKAVSIFATNGSVSVNLSLAVSAYLVTNREYVDILNALKVEDGMEGLYLYINTYNPSLPIYYDSFRKHYEVKAGLDEHPVVGVPWKGAKMVCELMGGRLLDESEWELCASSGNPLLRYPWGDEHPTIKRANYAEHVGATTPVGSYPCNLWGLYDLAGNAEEWCNNSSSTEGDHLERVVKGGSWNKSIEYLKIKSRRSKWSVIGTASISFRIVWDTCQ